MPITLPTLKTDVGECLRLWTRYPQVLQDSDLTHRSKTNRRPEVAHDKAAIIISYTGKCKTNFGYLTKML